MLDRLRIDQFVWTPYQNIDFMGQIPDMARSRVPLICFAIVEWHAADRVMNGLPNVQPLYHYSEYMQWYLQMTRKYISPDGAYSSGSYNFIRSIRDQCTPSTVHDNPMQFIHGIYLQCNEMIDAFAKLLPTAFSDSNYQTPPTMPVAPEFQQPFESKTQTDTHPQTFTQQTPVPQQPF
ncbi:hypothetical protein Lal_00019249 [Lupinus albus]|nr:hypothetical protein Lal_00019249 [Lupinus albus]